MKKAISAPSIDSTSTMQYHGYLLMSLSADAEWTRTRLPPNAPRAKVFEPFESSIDNFRSVCRRYRNRINKNYELLCKADPHNPERRSARGASLDPYIMEPISFLPIAHSDVLHLVLCDDMDSVLSLPGKANATLEEVSMAFCPKLESLGLKGRPFVEPDELFAPKRRPGPFLAFSKFRLDGLAALGPSLPFQEAVFRAMGLRIQKARKELLKQGDGLFSREDLDALSVSFCDLMGAEEVGALIFCRNLSVGMALVHAMRVLTFRDVLEAARAGQKESHLEYQLNKGTLHKMLVARSKRHRNKKVTEALRDNHIFRWSHTTVAVSHECITKKEQSACTGIVEAHGEYEIAPGHEIVAENDILDTCYLPSSTARNWNQDKWLPVSVGAPDLIQWFSPEKRFHRPPLVLVSDYLSAVARQYSVIRVRKRGEPELAGRNIFGLLPRLVVPIPRLSAVKSSSEWHCALLGDVLPKIERMLCGPLKTASSGGCQYKGRLSIEALQRAGRKLSLPLTLRRSLETLYRTFSDALKDPFLADVVLDLYGVLSALHEVITTLSTKEDAGLPKASTIGNRLVPVLDESRVRQIAELVSAINNAMTHRLTRLRPEVTVRERAIDFFGGLNQIVLASGAAIECGVDLLRMHLDDSTNKESHWDTHSYSTWNEVGAVTRIGLEPGARCNILSLGVEPRTRLAFFDVDVPHVFHAASHANYLHESFHVLFAALVADGSLKIMKEVQTSDELMFERLDEVFSIMLSQSLLFGDDVKSFAYHTALSYSRDLTSIGVDDVDTAARFTEIMIRLFLATMHTGLSKGAPRRGKMPDSGAAAVQFRVMLEDVGPFFSEFKRLWRGPNAQAYLDYSMKQFAQIYSEASKYIPVLWEAGRKVQDKSNIMDSKNAKMFGSVVRKSLENGCPVFWEGMNNRVSALTVISQVWKQYISTVKKAKNCLIHVYRDSKGNVVFPTAKPGEKWYDFQTDRGSTPLFCCVPELRRYRLRKQVAVCKTLWGISAQFRAKRLTDLVIKLRNR